jgi:hypothetical protein
MYTGL